MWTEHTSDVAGERVVGLTTSSRRGQYSAPLERSAVSLRELVADMGRGKLNERQLDFLRNREADAGAERDVMLDCAGDLTVLRHPAVSIVGTREVSDAGRLRAARLARELSASGVTVISGLARGVDTAALRAAVEAGGRVAAVIGTGLSMVRPSENAGLQEAIWRNHLLISPFRDDEGVYRSNFPKRNRVMAAISDATVIVEASDTSGTLHQAAECQRLGRWLFIMRSVVEDPGLRWPASFLGRPRTAVLEKTSDLVQAIG